MHVFIALIINYPSGVLRIVFEGKKIVCSKERKVKLVKSENKRKIPR